MTYFGFNTKSHDASTGLCTSKTYADGSTVYYTHTPDGLPLRTTYAGGRWVENVYDIQRQIVGTLSSDGANDLTIRRDAYGRVAEETNAIASAVCSRTDGGTTATNEAVVVDGIARTLWRTVDDQGRLASFGMDGGYAAQAISYRTDGRIGSVSNADVAVDYAYSDDGYDIGYTLSVAGGATFMRTLTRDPYRRELVLNITNSAGGNFAYAYDGCNIVLERIAFADGTTRTVEYFWGNDLSGTEQGAGGVGGLLAVSIDGAFFIPCYDHNGNIVCYVSESGTIAAQYVYDPYGNVIEQYGTLADRFAIRFSTKYTDVETGLISYLRRFYRPGHGRWLNRDPIEEMGGENLYAFCGNAPVLYYDVKGCWALIDNAIAFIGGAIIGVACQAVSDLIMQEASGWESYLGAAAGGAVLGELLLHNPAAAGASKAIYGGVSAAVGSAVRQVCEVNVSGDKERFDVKEFTIETTAGAALSMAPFFKKTGINRGAGSYLAVARSVSKKMSNGTISHVSVQTTVHSFIGVSTEYGMAYGAVQPFVTDKAEDVIDYFTILYQEYFSVNATDRCGNTVILNYKGEFKTGE